MNFSSLRHKPFIGSLLQLPFRLIPATAQARIVQGPLRGKKWIVGSSIHGCWLGSYEHEKQRIFRSHVRSGDVVYDLGANVGIYTLLASVLTGPSGRVYSFEPVPRNLRFLQKHLELNRIANVNVMDLAISSNDGCGQFDLGHTPLTGRLLLSRPPNVLDVRTAALDTLVFSGQIPPPNVIKCDIEGGEAEALRGARRTLNQYRPTVFLATHGERVHAECCRILTELRYRLASLDALPVGESRELLATYAAPTAL